MTLELSFILLNINKIVLSWLCAYCHYNQYNGTSGVLAEQKMKWYRKLEMIYVDTSTSTFVLF